MRVACLPMVASVHGRRVDIERASSRSALKLDLPLKRRNFGLQPARCGGRKTFPSDPARCSSALMSASATGWGDRRRRWNAGRACCLGAMQARARRQMCSHMRVPLGPDPERWFPIALRSASVRCSLSPGGSFWSSLWQPGACEAAAMRRVSAVASAISTSGRGQPSSLPRAGRTRLLAPDRAGRVRGAL